MLHETLQTLRDGERATFLQPRHAITCGMCTKGLELAYNYAHSPRAHHRRCCSGAAVHTYTEADTCTCTSTRARSH